MTLIIEHDEKNKQFVAIVEGKAATLKYSISPDGKTLDYYSTFVPPELRGRHIGQDIVKFALDFAKENGYQVIPSCPFVKTYIDRHSEYQGNIG
ncbi:MAG TPA: GNAT family N-acetyltransferase [Alphaproteobacteria bacterium]|nr:GNAT family N-acetyltransferase [Alphaproteobacteria bacterium]